MGFLQRALESLPAAAASPLAFIAYAVTIAAWLWAYQRTARLKVLLPQLELVPKNHRAEVIRREMGVVLPESIDPEQWMRARKRQYVLIAFLALCFLILCLVGITSWAVVHSNAQAPQSLRMQIDAAESKLQKTLDREKQQLIVAADASGAARISALHHPSPEIKELAEKLKALVAEFNTEVGTGALSKADNHRIRLAEGLVANAEGRYREASTIVPEEDVTKAVALAQERIDQAVKALQVRADAFYGLHDWKQALAHYERILKYRPDSLPAALSVANCTAFLGNRSDALEKYNAVVDILTRRVEGEGRQELFHDLARSLIYRGNALGDLGKRDEAVKDLDKAVAIYTRLVEGERRKELSHDFASSLSDRGFAFRAIGKLPEAVQDLDKAIAILSRLVEEGRYELSNDLASSLNNRGNAFRALGKLPEAVQDLNNAVDIRTRLVEGEDRQELSHDLARSLYNRSIALDVLGKHDEAVKDLDKASDILTLTVGPPSTNVTTSIPSFPWPPPKYSSSMVVPDNLFHKPGTGTDESLFVVAQRLENGFRSAGYGQLSYYAVPKGFAMATRLEQFALPDGTPLPLPDRWSEDFVPPKVFSLWSYFRALFGANPGHFRVIVLVVTSEVVAPNTKATVTREEASQWPTVGANRLPVSYTSIRYVDDDYCCTALIYEFEQGAADDPPEFKHPGLDARDHLKKANFFRGLW